MSKRHKAKGSHYEREFVREVQATGLPAARVPLSGAMEGYKDDVVVCDEFRVECKYRKDGAGFKRLHQWLGEIDESPYRRVLHLPESGLYVMRLVVWCALVRSEIDTGFAVHEFAEALCEDKKVATEQKTILGWMGEADALALRRAHHGWLVCIKTGEDNAETEQD